jgi:hypothetical protein
VKKFSTPLVDEHLQSLLGMQEAITDDFFYTRLKGKMQKPSVRTSWNLPLRPIWIIGTLILLLGINGFMLTQQMKTKTSANSSSTSPLQNFAESYDQTVSTY